MSGDNALLSLYGDGHIRAKQVRECVAMPGVRNQVVLTPHKLIACLHAFWPGGPAYDPCAADGSLVGAAESTATRGLIDPWPEDTYANPPYGVSLRDPKNELEAYLEELRIREEHKASGSKKAIKWPPGLPVPKAGLKDWLEMHADSWESILLCPNRSHRKWLRKWLRECSAVIGLDPLAFHNEKAAAPFPLVLGYRGDRVEEFVEAFAPLGDPI